MTELTAVQAHIVDTIALLQDRLGVRGKTLAQALRRARHRLPRRVYKQAMRLAQAEPMAAHPKLRLTLDTPPLARAAEEVQSHLRDIDKADRRKGWWLGVLGGMAFNILLLIILLLVALYWFSPA